MNRSIFTTSAATIRLPCVALAEIVVEVTGCHDASIEYTGGDRGWAGDIPRASLGIDKMLASGFDVSMNSEDAIRHTAERLLRKLDWSERP